MPMKSVDIIIYPGFKAIEAVSAVSVFEYANFRLEQEKKPPVYDITLSAPSAGMIRSDTLVVLEAEKSLSENDFPDIALVMGSRDIQKSLVQQPQLVNWCRRAAAKPIELLAGICTGTFFLAEAGLLNGLPATTHWSATAMLKSNYPLIDVKDDAIFVNSDKLWTSAGVTAVIDLALALIEKDLGHSIALDVARELVVFMKRPGGQAQFSQHLSSQMTRHDSVRDLQQWILTNLEKSHSVVELAKRVAMSPRNFTRVFYREVGCSPAVFVERSRIELARRQLEEGGKTIKVIAHNCGFSSDEHLRRVFKRNCGVTPKEYALQVVN
ncbi:GlxA family transcriptional regulator [Pantoea sp. S61]|nr:GlxA family transcriptional regulator [Pantoea sp. S61]